MGEWPAPPPAELSRRFTVSDWIARIVIAGPNYVMRCTAPDSLDSRVSVFRPLA